MLGCRPARWTAREGDLAISALVALALLPTAVAKSGKGPSPSYPVVEERTVGSGTSIRVLPAKVTVEMTKARRKPPKRLSLEPEVSDWIRQVGSDALRRKGFTLREMKDEASLVADVTEMSDRLLRPRPPSEAALDLMRRLGGEDAAAAVLIQHLKVEIGPEGRFDSHAGRIQLALETSTLRAALIRCSSGEVLWRGEMFIREVPWVEDPNFESAIAGTYNGLSLEGGRSDE